MFINIILLSTAFIDLRFCYQYYTNSEIEDTIRIESIETKRIRPASMIVGKGLSSKTGYHFVYTNNSKKFLLTDKIDENIYKSIMYKESQDVIKESINEGALSDVADDYIENIKEINEFKIKYIKTSRYNIITSIENVEQ